MAKKLYVGNLSYDTTEDELNKLFSEFGEIVSVAIITDKFSGKSKGFGFVEMAKDEEAAEAIKQLNDKDVGGRNLRVNEARPKTEGPSGPPPQ